MSQINTIQRCPHDKQNPYTQVLNSLIRDQSLSPNCRWLLIYLLSNKDGWVVSVKQVCNHLKEHMGRDKVRSLFDEAIKAGYMKREVVKVGNLNNGYMYYISEEPKFKNFYRQPEFQGLENEASEIDPPKKEHSANKKNSASEESAAASLENEQEGEARQEAKTLIEHVKRLGTSIKQEEIERWIKYYGIKYTHQTIAKCFMERDLLAKANQAGYVQRALSDDYFEYRKEKDNV